MIELAIMIEGQDGLTWPRWKRLANAAESLGFAGLYRSDHFTNADPPDKDSLELWTSLTWLAGSTRRIEFGPLVSPVSFRHPAFTARMAAAVDDLSGGRLSLGMGAGWQQREHEHFGFDLLDVPQRFARFEEGLEVVSRLLQGAAPVDFDGRYFRLKQALLLPRPGRPGGPPITIGGNGVKRTLPMVVKYASEWNAVYLTPQKFVALNRQVDALLAAAGRAASSLRRSLMHGCFFGKDEAAVQRKLGSRSRERLSQVGVVAGTSGQVVDQLGQFAEAGVQRIMLQWLEMDDLEGLEALAKDVLPQVMK
jgi:F420-dependent oxidoreductase-like protein